MARAGELRMEFYKTTDALQWDLGPDSTPTTLSEPSVFSGPVRIDCRETMYDRLSIALKKGDKDVRRGRSVLCG